VVADTAFGTRRARAGTTSFIEAGMVDILALRTAYLEAYSINFVEHPRSNDLHLLWCGDVLHLCDLSRLRERIYGVLSSLILYTISFGLSSVFSTSFEVGSHTADIRLGNMKKSIGMFIHLSGMTIATRGNAIISSSPSF
jgi:hypothetical protein